MSTFYANYFCGLLTLRYISNKQYKAFDFFKPDKSNEKSTIYNEIFLIF